MRERRAGSSRVMVFLDRPRYHGSPGSADGSLPFDPLSATWTREALLALYRAHQQEDEPYGECFQRLGAPRYAVMLREVLAEQELA